ncbi:MAG: putative motility protein [Lachnospiraceae bacterium]|nr:putative motility protein [Lachnospiraceae bacterium]
MDIAALSMSMAQTKLMDSVGIAMLDKTLEMSDEMAADFTAALDHSMELSVNPHIGANIDISI